MSDSGLSDFFDFEAFNDYHDDNVGDSTVQLADEPFELDLPLLEASSYEIDFANMTNALDNYNPEPPMPDPASTLVDDANIDPWLLSIAPRKASRVSASVPKQRGEGTIKVVQAETCSQADPPFAPTTIWPQLCPTPYAASMPIQHEQRQLPVPYSLPLQLPNQHLVNPTDVVDPSRLSDGSVVDEASERSSQLSYGNNLLNQFKDPVRALKVLDSFQMFDVETNMRLCLALEDEQTQAEVKVQAGKDIELLARRTLTNSLAHEPKNKRMLNRAAAQVGAQNYDPLPQVPSTWGQKDPMTGKPCFQYTPAGELVSNKRLSSEQMMEYIFHHRRGETLIDNATRSNLILWIQSTPSDCIDRYPHQESAKCRFRDCLDTHNTIRKGDFRVCFDEQPFPLINKDPYHNAGYVHLSCLERFCELHRLAEWVDIRPDTREHAQEKRDNRKKMAVTRDHDIQADVVNEYISSGMSTRGANDDFDYTLSLNYKLTVKHISLEPRTRHKTRIARGGNRLDYHLNDLEVYNYNVELKREHQKRGQPLHEHEYKRYEIRTPQNGKRKAHELDNDDENDGVVDTNPKKRLRQPIPPRRGRQCRDNVL